MTKRSFGKANEKQKRKAGRFSQTFYLTAFVFGVMLANAVILYGLWCIFDGMPWWQQDRSGLRLTIMILLGVSIFFAVTVVRIVGSKAVFSSIRSFNEVSGKVAKGDFSVRLPIPKERDLAGLAQTFNDMVEQLGRQQMLADSFISNVSHEFRNPLSAIRGYAQLLESDELTPEERKEYCAIIEEKAMGLSGMVTDILELSRLENQGTKPELTSYSLDEQLRQTVLVAMAAWKDKPIDMEVSIEPVTIEAPKDLMAQVWQNLIDNAIKFTPEGGRVSVILLDTPQEAVVRVEDTGEGMDEETQSRMFDKFYQGPNHRNGQGNGLGLALVQSVLSLYGAEVLVNSIPGEGTSIHVRLKKQPLQAAEEA